MKLDIQFLIFDFDGTLIDTGPDIIKAVNLFLEDQGRPVLDGHTIKDFIGTGLRDLIKKVLPGFQDDPRELQKIETGFLKFYDEVVLDRPHYLKDAEEFLKKCELPMSVVSNKRQHFLHKILKHKGIHSRFISVIGGDTFAEKKPHPMPVEAALKTAGFSAENTAIIGDGLPDIQVAKATGMTSIAVDFGYASIDTLMEAGADYRISSMNEIFQILS